MTDPLSLVSVLLGAGLLAGCAAGRQAAEAPRARVVSVAVLDAPAALGTADGIAFVEGGLSGLDRLADGDFVAVSDRGPNAEAGVRAGRAAKRFPFPAYAPSVVTLRLDGARLVEEARVALAGPAGEAVSGRPPPDSLAASVVEVALADTLGGVLPPDPWGVDAEGAAVAADGSLWIADEYRPSLWRLDARGRLVERFTPRPTEPFDRPLPAVLLARRPNYGFEGVAVLPDGRVAAVLQGPLDWPDAARAAGTDVARVLVLDPETGDAVTFAYRLDGPERKVGDVAALADGSLLVVEHGVRPGEAAWSAHVYRLDLARGAPVPFTAAPEAGDDVRLAPKTLVVDLLAAGWDASLTKPEGLAVVDATTLALVNDDDYGLATPRADGAFVATGVRTHLVTVRLTAPLPGF